MIPPANERRTKRHRAAALHDAGASFEGATPSPRGCGVWQLYAALQALITHLGLFIDLMLLPIGVWVSPYVGGYSLLNPATRSSWKSSSDNQRLRQAEHPSAG